jgi:hypothetical protein
MHIEIAVQIYEKKRPTREGFARLTISAPIDLALDTDMGAIVRLLLQQAHDEYLENVAGEGGDE